MFCNKVYNETIWVYSKSFTVTNRKNKLTRNSNTAWLICAHDSIGVILLKLMCAVINSFQYVTKLTTFKLFFVLKGKCFVFTLTF